MKRKRSAKYFDFKRFCFVERELFGLDSALSPDWKNLINCRKVVILYGDFQLNNVKSDLRDRLWFFGVFF